MKTFRQYMAESSDIRSRIRPAVMHDGKVHKAKNPTESHQEIVDRKGLDPKKSTRGFWLRDHEAETGKFLSPEEAAQHLGRGRTTADSTDLKDASDRMTFIDKDHDPFAGSYASPDQIKSNVLAIRKFGTTLSEGNPLSQDLKHRRKGIHKIIISAARKNLSNKKNEERTKTLYKRLKASGAIFKKTKGVWQNSAGEIENEKSVMAHLPNDPTGEKILSLGHKLRRKYNQDAFIHRTPDGKGTAHNRDGSTDVYGNRTASNVDNPYGETRFRPTKPADKQPKITFTDEPEPKSRRGSFKKLK